VEVIYEFPGMGKFVGSDPRGFILGTFIPSPTDQIEELAATSAVNLGV
jgi:hypothetical protein